MKAVCVGTMCVSWLNTDTDTSGHLGCCRGVQHQFRQLFQQLVERGFDVRTAEDSAAQTRQQEGRELSLTRLRLQRQRHGQERDLTAQGAEI